MALPHDGEQSTPASAESNQCVSDSRGQLDCLCHEARRILESIIVTRPTVTRLIVVDCC